MICSFMSPPPLLPRPLARQRNTLHDAAIAVVIVHRIVLRAAIVPERERAHLPREATGELGAHLVLKQVIKDRRAFLLRHAAKARGVCKIYIQRLAPRLGMRAH